MGLYVIGNLNNWQHAGHFQTLVTSLKTRD